MSNPQHAPPQGNICENPNSCTHSFPIVYRDLFIVHIVGTTTVLGVIITTPKIAKDKCYHYRGNHPGNVVARLSLSGQVFRDYPMGVVMKGPPLAGQLCLRCDAKCNSCASSRLPNQCYPETISLNPVCDKYCGFKLVNSTFTYNGEVTFTIPPRPRKRHENSHYRCASEALQ